MNLKKEIWRLLLIIALCAWLAPAVCSAQRTATVDTSFYVRYPYILFVESEADVAPLSDEAFISLAAPIIFPVNQYALPEQDKMFREIADEVIPQLNRDSMRVRRMVFRGAASPEGPYRWNQFLSERRAAALADYVQGATAFPPAEHFVTTLVEVEDYPLLCAMMKRAGDADYAMVRSLCEKYPTKESTEPLKRALQQAQGGALWKRLLRDYFPRLRAARVVLYIEKSPEAATPLAIRIPETAPLQADTLVAPPAIKPERITPSEPYFADFKMPRRELLSVKTNLLFYGIYMPGYNRYCPIPNIAIEYYPRGGHFTYGASFDMPWWQDYDGHKYFQIRNYQLETRYYLRSGSEERTPPGTGAAFRGLYLQGYVHAGLFGICFDANRGWVGEGAGVGLGIGYVMPLSRKGHWRLEFGLQAGFFRCKYDPYQFENPVNPNYRDGLYYYKWTDKPSLFKKRQYRWNWFGPTRIGITLTYDLLYRRIQKKGASFKSYETERRIVPIGAPLREISNER